MVRGSEGGKDGELVGEREIKKVRGRERRKSNILMAKGIMI